jgi:hypothetical protein
MMFAFKASKSVLGRDSMFARANNRRVAMVLVIMMAVVAIAIPTCTMIGCDMGMGSGMPFMPSGAGIFNSCSGEWITSTGPAGLIPSGGENLVLALSAVLLAAVAVVAPRSSSDLRPAMVAEPPPPPEDPLGQRTRI